MIILPENSTVYLIEDDVVLRKIICHLFESIKIDIKSFENPNIFLEHCDKQGLDNFSCIISDIRLPSMSGLELFTLLKQRGYNLPIIFISAYATVKMAVSALKNGAFDFLSKPFDNQELIDSVQGAFLHLKKLQPLFEIQNKMQTLSRREKEILKIILTGRKNKEISFNLGISASTVEIHRVNIAKKLGIKSLTDLLKYSQVAEWIHV